MLGVILRFWTRETDSDLRSGFGCTVICVRTLFEGVRLYRLVGAVEAVGFRVPLEEPFTVCDCEVLRWASCDVPLVAAGRVFLTGTATVRVRILGFEVAVNMLVKDCLSECKCGVERFEAYAQGEGV